MHLLWILSAVLSSIFAYSNLTKRYEVAMFFNQFFKYQKQLEGSWLILFAIEFEK